MFMQPPEVVTIRLTDLRSDILGFKMHRKRTVDEYGR